MSKKAEKEISCTTKLINKTILIAFLLFVFTSPFVIFPKLYDFANLPQSVFIQTSSLFFITILFVTAIIQQKFKFEINLLLISILLLLLWTALSISWSINKYEGIKILAHWTASFMALCFVSWKFDKNHSIILLNIILSAGCCIAVIGLLQYFFDVTWFPQTFPPAATFANKNMAVHVIIMTIGPAIGFFFNTENKKRMLTYGTACSVMTAYIICTGTRAGWIALALQIIGGICLFIITKHPWSNSATPPGHEKNEGFFHGKKNNSTKKKSGNTPEKPQNSEQNFKHNSEDQRAIKFIFIFMVLFITTLVAFFYFFNFESDKLTHSSIDEQPSSVILKKFESTSIFIRISIWNNTLAMIKDHFSAGVGIGNHKIYYPLYACDSSHDKFPGGNNQLVHVHNDFLQLCAELGITGIILLLFIFTLFVRLIYSFMLKIQFFHKTVQCAISGIILSTTGIFIIACFSFPFHRAIPPFFMMLFTGILIVFYKDLYNNKKLMFQTSNKKRPEEKTKNCNSFKYFYFKINCNPLLSIPIAALTLLLFIFSIQFSMNRIKSDQFYSKMIAADKVHDWHGTIENAKNAIAYNPFRKKIFFYLGRAWAESGNFDKAINAFQKAIADYPYNPQGLLNLGIAYKNNGNYEEALRFLKKSSYLIQKDAYIHILMADIYKNLNQPEKALDEFQTALLYDPENPSTHFKMGILALETKLFEKARQGFENAVRLRPSWDMANRNLGIVMFQFLGQQEKGIKYMKKALEINPAIRGHEKIRYIINKIAN